MTAKRGQQPLWSGAPPPITDLLYTGTHGGPFVGLWHVRQVNAFANAWLGGLIDKVLDHGHGLYTVPSQTTVGKYYAVQRYALAPDGYLWVCDCPASEQGGWVCAHAMAAYLWRLEHKLGWRLKPL